MHWFDFHVKSDVDGNQYIVKKFQSFNTCEIYDFKLVLNNHVFFILSRK